MSEIRSGSLDWHGATAADCLFCGAPVVRGAYWCGVGGELAVCGSCVLDGKLGLLIGDALERPDQIMTALQATGSEAWRSRALAHERVTT